MPPAARRAPHGPGLADVATLPYAAIWEGAIAPLAGTHGVLSVHRRPDLAVAVITASWRATRWVWGAYPPWFRWRVVDRRDGTIIHKIY